MRVLVYETSEDRAKLIQDLLGTYRYKIFHKNGDSISLTPIQEIKPSLIIMNASCREHVELFEKIKQNSRYSKIPIILISKMDSIEIFKKYNQYKNVDFLVEPFRIKNFRHIVERWITFRSLYVN
jgi:response regulator RpfG family c-di-GMP phosphodiesterase